MGFLSDVINDAKPRAPLPVRSARAGSLPPVADNSVIIAGPETAREEAAAQMESHNVGENSATELAEHGSTPSQPPIVSASISPHGPMPTEQASAPDRRPRTAHQSAVDEPPGSPTPETDISNHADIPIADTDSKRPLTESSQRQMPQGPANDSPTKVSVPAPLIVHGESTEATEPLIAKQAIPDAVASWSKPGADTETPLYASAEQSLPLEQTQASSTRQPVIDQRTTEPSVSHPAQHPASASVPSPEPSIGAETGPSEQTLPKRDFPSVPGIDSALVNATPAAAMHIEAPAQQTRATRLPPPHSPPSKQQPEPTVQIGHVDILVCAPEAAPPQTTSEPKPHNIASRRYLRRL